MLVSMLFGVYVNDVPTPSHHTELVLDADNTALIATFHSPLLLVRYLETYLNRLELWLWDWKIAISVLKSTVMLCQDCKMHPKTQASPAFQIQYNRLKQHGTFG
jgi:hypothetical protein